jgi:hypothetical protein
MGGPSWQSISKAERIRDALLRARYEIRRTTAPCQPEPADVQS